MSTDTDNLLVWGIDGELSGNEARLMACLPFFTREGTPGVLAARALDWSIDPERNLLHIASEDQALELGDKLTLASPLQARPGALVVVVGPNVLQNMIPLLNYSGVWALESELRLSVLASPEGFRAICLDPAAYEQIGCRLAAIAKTGFDKEIGKYGSGADISILEAALSLLKGSAFTKVEELAVRRLIVARIKKDADAYRTALELAAIRLKETPEKVNQMVESHFKILTEASPFKEKTEIKSRYAILWRPKSYGLTEPEAPKPLQGRIIRRQHGYIPHRPLHWQVKTKDMSIGSFRAISWRGAARSDEETGKTIHPPTVTKR